MEETMKNLLLSITIGAMWAFMQIGMALLFYDWVMATNNIVQGGASIVWLVYAVFSGLMCMLYLSDSDDNLRMY